MPKWSTMNPRYITDALKIEANGNRLDDDQLSTLISLYDDAKQILNLLGPRFELGAIHCTRRHYDLESFKKHRAIKPATQWITLPLYNPNEDIDYSG